MQKKRELNFRPSKINPVFWIWVSLYGLGLAGSIAGTLYHGTLAANWRVISIVGLMAILILLGLRIYMRFPIITVTDGSIKLEVFWEKCEINYDSITRVRKERGFAAKPALGNFLFFTRPYWRIEILYLENGRQKDVDIDLTQFRKQETEELLAALKRLRPDLDMPSLDRRGL